MGVHRLKMHRCEEPGIKEAVLYIQEKSDKFKSDMREI